MWNKILEYNWKTRNEEEIEELENEFITGTNGATIKEMKSLNGYLRKFLSAVEIPVFGAAVLAILVLGEQNFFSKQVNYQTEPIASIGRYLCSVLCGETNIFRPMGTNRWNRSSFARLTLHPSHASIK